MSTVDGQDKLLDAPDAAKLLGVSKAMVYKLLRQGELQGFVVGTRKKIYLSSVEAYIRKNRIGSAPAPQPAPVQKAAAKTPKGKKK